MTVLTVTIPAHPEMMGWEVLGIHVVNKNVINRIVNYTTIKPGV